jgi:dihydroxyacetone kinase DhaKLM complex PTS-EIIA-like component DhaM
MATGINRIIQQTKKYSLKLAAFGTVKNGMMGANLKKIIGEKMSILIFQNFFY